MSSLFFGMAFMQENTIPWIIKIIPAIVGAILALVLSGDIDKEGKFKSQWGLLASLSPVSL